MTDQGIIQTVRRYFLIFGTSIAYALGFYTIYLFMKAYFTGSKAIIFAIDYFGEANMEFVMMVFCAGAMVYSLGYIVRHLREIEKN